MCTIKINTKCKQYKKEDKMTQKSINSSLMRLSSKIAAEGGKVQAIFNTDSVVYDRINDQMYIYKAHGVNNIQLRIVYSYEKVNGESVVYLIDYTVKKSNDKQYISDMNRKFKKSRLSDMVFSEVR